MTTTTPLGDPNPLTQEIPSLLPRARSAGSRDGAAPLRDNGYQTLHLVLFWAGAILLPTGIVVIILGWYGAAHTPYQYDQLSYLVSGGLLGLGLTFCGGFLYFGAWLARMTADNQIASRRLSDTLLQLAEVTARSAAQSEPDRPLIVVAGAGTTTHRRDCPLIAHRDDLTAVGDDAPARLVPCRICNP